MIMYQPRVKWPLLQIWIKEKHEEPTCMEQQCCQAAAGAQCVLTHPVHACDPRLTPHPICMVKELHLKKFGTNDGYHAKTTVSNIKSASKVDVVAAGDKALVCLYNGKLGEDSTHYSALLWKGGYVYVSSTVDEFKPPLQQQSIIVSACTTRCTNGRESYELLPSDWGWNDSNQDIIPVLTDLPPAPQELLQVTKFSCKTECSSLKCTCKKRDLSALL